MRGQVVLFYTVGSSEPLTYILKITQSDFFFQDQHVGPNCGRCMSPVPLDLVSVGRTDSVGSSL